mmetsp:Transcript_55457/g.154564  ORF Transcript_55457/g.154564 Transcript_55457/m.154564 type:complete len:379 (-) Transcript_55457:69-1205(-)
MSSGVGAKTVPWPIPEATLPGAAVATMLGGGPRCKDAATTEGCSSNLPSEKPASTEVQDLDDASTTASRRSSDAFFDMTAARHSWQLASLGSSASVDADSIAEDPAGAFASRVLGHGDRCNRGNARLDDAGAFARSDLQSGAAQKETLEDESSSAGAAKHSSPVGPSEGRPSRLFVEAIDRVAHERRRLTAASSTTELWASSPVPRYEPKPPEEAPPRCRPRTATMCRAAAVTAVAAAASALAAPPAAEAAAAAGAVPPTAATTLGSSSWRPPTVPSPAPTPMPAAAQRSCVDCEAAYGRPSPSLARRANLGHERPHSDFIDPRIERAHFLQAVQLVRERAKGMPRRPLSALARSAGVETECLDEDADVRLGGGADMD